MRDLKGCRYCMGVSRKDGFVRREMFGHLDPGMMESFTGDPGRCV